MKIIIAIPAYNEEAMLDSTIKQVVIACERYCPSDEWTVVIGDNASTDHTARIAQTAAAADQRVAYRHVSAPGKGAAVLGAWQKHDADIYCFMDADLATDLEALPRLLAPIRDGADVVVGSRFHKESRVRRSRARRMYSLGYRLFLRLTLGVRTADVPCGFKALSRRAYQELVPLIENKQWFFDSELIIVAEALQHKIVEIPVDWAERRPAHSPSRVGVVRVTISYARAVFGLRQRLGKIVSSVSRK